MSRPAPDDWKPADLPPLIQAAVRTARQMLVRSSATPLSHLYRLAYRTVLVSVLRSLRPYGAVKAIYLRHSFATGKMLGGVSDIDLVFICDGDDPSHPAFRAAWLNVRRRFRIVEALESPLWELRYLPSALRVNWIMRQYWTDAQHEWVLLYGEDLRQTLPAIAAGHEDSIGYAEIGMAWSLFARKLIASRNYRCDSVMQGSICCKMAAGALKGALALQAREIVRTRDEAVSRLLPSLPQAERSFIAATREHTRRRYLSVDAGFADETSRFLLALIDRTLIAARDNPLFRALPDVTLRPDAPLEEFSNETWGAAGRLTEHARRLFGEAYRAAFVAGGTFAPVGEAALLIQVDNTQPPTADQLSEFMAARPAVDPETAVSEIYLLLAGAAFQLGIREFLGAPYHRLVSPTSHPDLFSVAAFPGFRIDGPAEASPPAAVPSNAYRELVHSDLLIAQADFDKSAALTEGGQELRAAFWKLLQLNLTAASLTGAEWRTPLTQPAIERALEHAGITCPEELAALRPRTRASLDKASVGMAREFAIQVGAHLGMDDTVVASARTPWNGSPGSPLP